jgi:hydroxypyruvate isomerase
MANSSKNTAWIRLCATVPKLGLYDGFGDKTISCESCIENYTEMIPMVAAGRLYQPDLLSAAARRGKTDEEGWNNCVEGLKPTASLAEKHNVVLVMELLEQQNRPQRLPVRP